MYIYLCLYITCKVNGKAGAELVEKFASFFFVSCSSFLPRASMRGFGGANLCALRYGSSKLAWCNKRAMLCRVKQVEKGFM